MTHNSGRHMMYKCEHCSHAMHGEGFYNEAEDEYWCGSCVDNANEAAYERHQEWLIETGGGPSLAEQQAAAKRLK